MKALLAGGNQVPAYLDYYEAKADGLLSRSAWRRLGYVVPKDAVPVGIVVRNQTIIHKMARLAVPILKEMDDCLLIVDSWYDVFSESQAVKHGTVNTKVPVVTSASIQQEEGENPEWGSLMTQEVSELPVLTDVTDTHKKQDNSNVNNVRAYVPEGLILPDNCPIKEQLWWFLGLLYWKHLEQRQPWDTPINLMYDHLKQNIPNWPKVWESCDRLGLVERTAGYTPGERAYGYWTALPYRNQIHRLRSFQHPGIAKRLRAIQRRHLSRPIMAHLRRQLDRLSVDMDGFHSRFATSPNRHYYLAHLQTILDGELRLTSDDFSGRLHSNVSNMYKPLRALLRVDGEPDTLRETDIKNSQPLFLGLAAKEAGVDDRRYLGLCEQGVIYEHIANRLGILRESAKHEMVMLLYAKNGFRSTAKSVFELEFPQMAAYVHRTKARDHKRLARQMQRAERKFVIDTVCERLRRLREEMFVATIHDALLARKADCDLVVDVMKEEFAKRGVNPRLEWHDVDQDAPGGP